MILLALFAFVAAAAQPPGDFAQRDESETLSFEYGWPAAADALPLLRETLRADMERARAQARHHVEQGQAAARENGQDFIPHYYEQVWQVAGDTPQLLSLTAAVSSFAGGAHGNVDFAAILWNRAEDLPVTAAEVLGEAAIARLADRYCAALDAERAERRGEPVRRDPEDEHTMCPPLDRQVLAPRDEDGNGRFEALDVLIAPYVAGPYAEGAYFAAVPFQASDLAGIADAYRGAFEAVETPAAAAAEAACPSGDIDLPRGPGSVCIGRLTEGYAFTFAWPAAAARIPALDALLRAEAGLREAWIGEEADSAPGERAEAGADRPPIRFSYQEAWAVDAALPELIAASGHAEAYTGGAHGGLAYHAILIDPRSGERIALADLFADRAAGLGAVQASLCPALLAEVRTRRGEDSGEAECPTAAEHPLTMMCGAGGRIDLIVALFNPYVVGSWAEGPYEVAFPVTPQILAALKPEYRGAFAVGPEAPSELPVASRCD